MDESLQTSQKKLTEEFFHRQNAELLEKMRAELGLQEKRAALAEASGIRNAELLDELVKLNISPETMPALKLVPLIFVAWADKEIQPKERAVILEASEKNNIRPGSDAFRLLESWLESKPDKALMETWKDYVASVCSAISPGGVRMLREEILDSSEQVATSSGGILGFGALSASEAAVLKELHAAFPTAE